MSGQPPKIPIVLLFACLPLVTAQADTPADTAARPLALASADFDEDGTPDLLLGLAPASGGGEVRINRGRREPATFFIPLAPEILATGDFDADGHVDVVAAEHGAARLFVLLGDGAGSFARSFELPLSGSLDALAAGIVNRPDGLIDLAVAVSAPTGPLLEIFESPMGAATASPESIPLPAETVDLAIGDLDGDFLGDIVVATRNSLVTIAGRDRRLASSRRQRDAVPKATVSTFPLAETPVAMTLGRILAGGGVGIALLDQKGRLTIASGIRPGSMRPLPGSYDDGSRLSSGHLRPTHADDLLVLDKASGRIHLLSVGGELEEAVLGTSAPPVGAVPMSLDGDALDDLVMLHERGTENLLAAALSSIQSILVVTNANDSGAGSLRQAILDANALSGPDSITFSIPGSGVQIINALSALPPLAGSITLDGTTQPGYAGSPLIEINGLPTPPSTDGLILQNGNNVVRGLEIGGFPGSGIVIDGAGHNLVESNYLGTDPTGLAAHPNLDAGVIIRNSHLNTLGGTSVAQRNVIAGNLQRNVAVLGSPANAAPFSYAGPGIAICDLCTVSLPIYVLPEERITDVDVMVNLAHTYDGDLRITLIAPDSTRVTLSEFNGGSGDNYSNTVFDDQSVTPISSGSAPFTGLYAPQQPLSVLNGPLAQGWWSLEVQDAAPGDSGFLLGWSLTLQTVGTFGNTIQGNFIGTNAAGSGALSSPEGIVIESSPGNLVGGTAAGARNLIAGASGQNAGNGVHISGPLSIQNLVQGNFIGTNLAGTQRIPNDYAGVLISNASMCLIGGTAAGAGNLISGNGVWGIRADQSDRIDVQGNLIGTTASGSAALGNNAQQSGGAGLIMTDGTDNTVGGSVTAARNVISGNTGQSGITFFDYNPGCCFGNTAIGNYVGTDASGTAALPNQSGIYMRSHGSFVGGPGPGEGNLVSGNEFEGVFVSLDTDDSFVQGNLIGLDKTGTLKLGNGFGVGLSGRRRVTLGGTTAGTANTISGNVNVGIEVDEDCPSNSLNSTAQPNLTIPDLATITSAINEPSDETILRISVTVNLAHTYDSDLILTLISPGGERVILANRRGGSGDNYLGTVFGAFASTPIASGSPPFTGTFIPDEPLALFVGQRTLGTWTLEISDVASGDQGFLFSWSIDFSTNLPADDRILGNYVGTNAAGASGIGNGGAGIEVSETCGLSIGGSSAGEGNVVSGNGGSGLRLIPAGSTGTSVKGNLIGVKPDGITPLGNAGSGILVLSEAITIGGPIASDGNHIANNGGPGIEVWSLNTLKQTAIRANLIHDNGGLGIDLDSDGVTPNDPGDGDFGANLHQNFPVVTGLNPFFSSTFVNGTISSTPNSKLLIDVYASQQGDSTGYGEGQTWLGTAGVATTDGSGLASWSVLVPYSGLGFVSATATDFVGNTSEFGPAFSNPMEASPAGNMTVAPNGGTSLAVNYAPACGAANHVIFQGLAGPGMIGAGLAWTGWYCGLGVSGTAAFDPMTPALNHVFYFVIVGQNAAQEGSYGRSSSGLERPEATQTLNTCDRPQILPAACQ